MVIKEVSQNDALDLTASEVSSDECDEIMELLKNPPKGQKKIDLEVPIQVKAKSGAANNARAKQKGTGKDIVSQLNSHMQSSLDKELGFSINKALAKSASDDLVKSKAFQIINHDIERERAIRGILCEETEINYRLQQNEETIERWIAVNVDPKVLRQGSDNTSKYGLWLAKLRKTLHEIASESNQAISCDILNEKILEFPEYCKFKAFVHTGSCKYEIDDALYFFKRNCVQTLIDTLDIQFVESYKGKRESLVLKKVLDDLGFDTRLLNGKYSKQAFDNKARIPPLGCGLQVLKFVKIIESVEFDFVSTLKSLILMSLDENLEVDTYRYNYKGNKYTGREIAIKKIEEYWGKCEMINGILMDLFSENVKLWHKFINSIQISYMEELRLFKSKLILKFLDVNNIIEDISIDQNFQSFRKPEEVMRCVHNYLKTISNKCLPGGREEVIEATYMNMSMIKELMIVNDSVLKSWRVKDEETYRATLKGIHKIKNNFFQNYRGSFNSKIPECKRLLEFMYYEISEIEVEDFFC